MASEQSAAAIDFKVHTDPVWRERANFLIQARVEHEGSREIHEQLWSRQLAENRFEICCIPFFVFDLALGDEVEAELSETAWLMQRVVKRSGRETYWVWFMETATIETRKAVDAKVKQLGCLFEWYSSKLLALDVASELQVKALKDAIMDEERQGLLECVPARSDNNSET